MGWFTPSPTRVYGHDSYYGGGGGSGHRQYGGSGRRQYYVSSSSSHYKRRPRDGYIERLVHQLRRLIRRLIAYARDNPVRVFMIVVMPLITGGALQQVLRQFGIRLPMGLSRGAGSSTFLFTASFSRFSISMWGGVEGAWGVLAQIFSPLPHNTNDQTQALSEQMGSSTVLIGPRAVFGSSGYSSYSRGGGYGDFGGSGTVEGLMKVVQAFM